MVRLRFPEQEIPHWASRYPSSEDTDIQERIAPAAKRRGHLTRREFLATCGWKTPRTASRCKINSEEFIREVTRASLHSKNEEFKIRGLTLLHGVSWPTASVILHWCDRGQYPILDYRALWSLGVTNPPPYTFPFWQAYCAYTRDLASRTRCSMRVVDRALWQYSKEKQG